jgi:SAM-dependent methyltransferase
MGEWTDIWNERFRAPEYAYGEAPNEYLREKLDQLTPGKILFAAEGEGRNAVYAAQIGWNVIAFDISEEGRQKAIKLAEKNKVSIDYQVGRLDELSFSKDEFDAIALIYAHFPAKIKSVLHRSLATLVRPGGIIIFEAFSKNHLEYIKKNPNVGGPKEIDMLFSTDEIRSDFAGFEIMELTESVIELKEGLYHNGTGSVIRFMGRKK